MCGSCRNRKGQALSVSVDIEKKLGDFHLKTAFSAGDEVLSLLGASGSGKSVTLKCIAGILKPDAGCITVNGRVLYDSGQKICFSPQKRRTGYLFQNYALFPNMTVADNIRMGCKGDGGKNEEIDRIMERFRILEIAGLYPDRLSGGQQQRVALARILISKPDILLLDEPFSALDHHLRFRVEEELRAVIREFQKTVILVSHNRDEVFRLSDRVVILKNGQVDVAGSREEVFQDPKTCNAAALTGCKNISPVRILDGHHLEATDWGLKLNVEKIPEDTHFIGLRMHYIYAGDGENATECDVEEEIENPFSYTLMLRVTGSGQVKTFGWEVDKKTWEENRQTRVKIHIPQSSLHFLKR